MSDSETSEETTKTATEGENADSGDEFQPTPLSEYDSYNEFYEEEMKNDPMAQPDEVDIAPWKLTALKLAFYGAIAIFLLFIGGLILYVALDIITHLAEFAGEYF